MKMITADRDAKVVQSTTAPEGSSKLNDKLDKHLRNPFAPGKSDNKISSLGVLILHDMLLQTDGRLSTRHVRKFMNVAPTTETTITCNQEIV